MNTRFCIALLLITVAASCSKLEPWVKPYERANMADPIMSFSRDPVSDSYKSHVYEAREGSRGADVGAGGGCGCN